jgi:hypothetical protein
MPLKSPTSWDCTLFASAIGRSMHLVLACSGRSIWSDYKIRVLNTAGNRRDALPIASWDWRKDEYHTEQGLLADVCAWSETMVCAVSCQHIRILGRLESAAVRSWMKHRWAICGVRKRTFRPCTCERLASQSQTLPGPFRADRFRLRDCRLHLYGSSADSIF